MSLVKQCKDTFIRRYGEIGYIINQLTKHDRIYDNVGAYFLDQISRKPKYINDIIDSLQNIFADAERELLYNDFIEFIQDLEKDMFVLTAENELAFKNKAPYFSYQNENPKTITHNFSQKNDEHIFTDTADFFYDYLKNSPTLLAMHMEVTSRCNEKCIHCYIPEKNKNKDIDFSFAKNLMDQAREMGVVNISFSGGEPFLHPEIRGLLEYARSKDLIITILSNATQLNFEMCQFLKEININFIQISLYSMHAEEHDAITSIKGSHQKTLKAIETLIDLDIPVQISCPVMKANKRSYREVLNWAYQNKIKAYTDFIMMARTDFNTENLHHRLSLSESKELLQDIIEFDETYKLMLEMEPKSKDMEHFANQPICGVGIDNICVSAEGDFYPCPGFQGFCLGNAYKESLREVWNNSERTKLLRTLKNSSFPQCLECEARDYCSMCLVRNFNESGGDMFKINNHFCDVAFINKEIAENYRQQRE